ncbi:hypothetical protein SPRG_05401 [Saprolegnia parasitica CBS 223.65]|uniref:C2 domain-containing protein n=1 Tax=Saprolegnia parasitica (strain CBS 223.65) TaxID=695850 RepID=A0A067CQU0_SAPPC|nr:hypothetical protein SPRG_05401 [Saprolegnia parasitica CBS 223.65]KDO29157.1 hypothetical protein SPRG_05401 [Saprolegnia parasitica CBS 223.65]|eukprot:XP_012200036.1 hypothetical protein SPRG_05401 [Saprolegnia parasitica CBS 223.65]
MGAPLVAAVVAVTLSVVVLGQTSRATGKPDKRVEALNLSNAFSCAGGPTLCPDAGTFKSAGGNLTVTVIEMRNLPNLDGFGAAGGLTDAFIRVAFGTNSRDSSFIRNSLNPSWAPCRTLGCLGYKKPSAISRSGTAWDKDDGLEFADDFIGGLNLNVIYCTALTAYKQKTPNAGMDSSFAMPLQPVCVEEIWLPLAPGECIVNGTVSTTLPCLRLRQTVVPFQVQIEETYATTRVATMAMGLGGYYGDATSTIYGRVWTPGNQRLQPYYKMAKSQGGVLVRMDNNPGMNNDYGNASLAGQYGFPPLGRFSINFPSAMYVFRRQTDFGYVDAEESAQIVNIADDFVAVTRNVSATPVNTYGDALGGGIVVGPNIQASNRDITLSMYFIVLVPNEGFFDLEPIYSKEFSQNAFFLSALQFGIAFAILLFMSVRYCEKMHFRLDRVQAYLAEIAREVVDHEDDDASMADATKPLKKVKKLPPSVVSLLFLCYNDDIASDDEANATFRRHLYYAQIAVNVCVASPFVVLWTWGFTAISTVQPPAVGFFLIFIGSGVLIGYYGLRKWTQMGWRMTKEVRVALGLACICGFLFLFSSIFADPKVFIGGANVDFFSLTAFFLSLNMMPMIWLVFTNDDQLSKSLAQVLAVVTISKKHTSALQKAKHLGDASIKLAAASDTLKHKRGVKPLSAFDALLGAHYSVARTIPGFELADILQNAFVTPPEHQKRTNRRCYALALGILLVYTIVAIFRSAYPTQGIGIFFTIFILDATFLLVWRGQLSWSAGYISLLLGLCRVALVVSCGTYWLLGQTMAFSILGSALCREIIGRNLPRMGAREAGGITFFGHDSSKPPLLDLSATPEFGLGFLSFFFLFLLVGVAFTATTTVTLPILGQRWPLYVFGVLAFVLVLFSGLVLASSRAFYLMKQHLLSEHSANVYLGVPGFKLPFVLAAGSELLVVCSGLFLFAATQSSFVLLTSVFLPVLLMLGMVVWAQWRRNDHRLVVWPPEDGDDDDMDDDAFDEEAEFAKEADALRSAFVLPSLQASAPGTEFKMPPLPVLKGSALLGLGGAASSVLQLAGQTAESSKPDDDDKNNQKTSRVDDDDELEAAAKEADVADAPPVTTPLDEDGNPTMRDIEILDAPVAPTTATVVAPPRRSCCARLRAFIANARSFLSHPWKKYSVVPTAEVDFEKMSVIDAYRGGYLLEDEYQTLHCFAALLGGIFLYGFCATFTEAPPWIGETIWVGSYIFIFSVSPVFKWYHVVEITSDIRASARFSYGLAWVLGIALFVDVLELDVNDVQSLWILVVLIYYPLTLLFIVAVFKWHDDNWVLSPFVRSALLMCAGWSVLFLFVMFIWASIPIGGVFAFLIITFSVVVYFLLQWVRNDYYLAPVAQRRANQLVVGTAVFFIALALFFGVNLFYCFSISIIVILLKLGVNGVAIKLCREPDLQIFYSPYVFPIFSYNATTNNVNNENQEAANVYKALGVVFAWGCVGVMFTDPLGFGIGLCSLALLAFVGFTAHLCSITPVRMGLATKYVHEAILHEAATVAKEEAELEYQRLSYGKQKSAQLAAAMAAEASAAPPARLSAADNALAIHETLWQCSHRVTTKGRTVRRRDALFTLREILIDVFRDGKGPLGYIGLFGCAYKAYVHIKAHRYTQRALRFLPDRKRLKLRRSIPIPFAATSAEEHEIVLPPLAADDDDDVDAPEAASVTEDTLTLLRSLPGRDVALDAEFFEETRCIIHFQLLLLNAADARLSRERVLFQKFLRENRFKLMSNGINPPADIFKTSSHASIDIPLVATWLMSLTPEERARFHALKAAFSQEMDRKDAVIDAEDAAARAREADVRGYWAPHEANMCRKMYEESVARRTRRESEGIAVETGVPEAIINAREALAEIESGYACIVGQFGRSLQFVDPEFPPTYASLAGCVNEAEVVDWRVSTGINITAGLFDGGTDPDDVRFGRLHDGWFLSAVSIIAASDGVDDGKVDALIDNLFITKQTSLTGAYAIRFFKNSQWETVIVDDYFPILDDTHKMDMSGGAAFAHSAHFEELWVPLLEKAYAKYHGGYAALETGFVHHALRDLTGFASDEVFLAQASRGARKKTLWKQLLSHKRNRFLLGAGTISSDNADHEILDTGLVFGACYVVYDVREIDGHELVKLRNPPGDHPEWRGDWGDDSPLWTRRLKKHLGIRPDANDNTFWMSFDDFCNAFRCLYICKYYDPAKWLTQTFHGNWSVKADTAGGLPTRHNPDGAVEANPHFALSVSRPTEVILTITQIDEKGLAPVTVLPIAVYIVAGAMGDRASRVKVLTRDVVVEHSGPPVRERQLVLRCNLAARTYTVLVAAYKAGMEGPFQMSLQTNYAVGVDQIWPAVWREPKNLNAVEKMALRVKDAVADSSAVAKLAETTTKYKNKIVAGVNDVLEDDEDDLHELEEAKVSQEKATKKSPWVEQWDDAQNKPFYYNKETGSV